MQTSLDYGGFTIQTVAAKVGISLMEFAGGFANVRLYAKYRKDHPLEHHCIALSKHGLTQNLDAFACLDQALVAPFGILTQQVRAFSKGDKSIDLNAVFSTATKSASRLLAYFGPHWLAKEPPSEQQEQIDRLTLGMFLGFDILVAETARQFGFLGACFGLTKEDIVAAEKCEWRTMQRAALVCT